MLPVGSRMPAAPLKGPEPEEPVSNNGKQTTEGESKSPTEKQPSSPTTRSSALAESQMSSTALETELRARFGTPKKPSQETEIANDPNLDDNGYFKDADKLRVGKKDQDDASTTKVVHDMIRSDLNGSKPGVFFKHFPETFEKSSSKDQEDYRYALHDALQDKELVKKIDSDPAAKARMESVVRKTAGTDPSIKENAKANATVDNFKDWDKYKYKAVIVPGYTPLDQKTPLRLDPVGKERLEAAVKAYKSNAAPFIIVERRQLPSHKNALQRSLRDETGAQENGNSRGPYHRGYEGATQYHQLAQRRTIHARSQDDQDG